MRRYTVIALLGFIGIYASSYGNTYTDNGADHLWNTSANWSGGVPVQGASNQWADMTVAILEPVPLRRGEFIPAVTAAKMRCI